MEIKVGEFYFQAEQTVALVIVVSPIMLLMYTTRFVDSVKQLKEWVIKKKRKAQSYKERITEAGLGER